MQSLVQGSFCYLIMSKQQKQVCIEHNRCHVSSWLIDVLFMDIGVSFSPFSHKEEIVEHDTHQPCAVQVVQVLLIMILTQLVL